VATDQEVTLKKIIIGWVYVAVVACSGSAYAEEADRPRDSPPADRMRSPGTVVLDDIAGGTLGGPATVSVGWLTYQSAASEQNGTKSSSTMLGFMPSADVFIADGFSIGGAAGVSRSVSRIEMAGSPDFETTSTLRTVSPRIGYAFKLTDDLLFWPRFHAGIGWTDAEVTSGAAALGSVGALGTLAPSQSGVTWSVGGDASFVFVLGRHAAIAAGPQLQYTHSKVDEPRAVAALTSLGVRAGLRIAF
jgi:hypothetical protein